MAQKAASLRTAWATGSVRWDADDVGLGPGVLEAVGMPDLSIARQRSGDSFEIVRTVGRLRALVDASGESRQRPSQVPRRSQPPGYGPQFGVRGVPAGVDPQDRGEAVSCP
jgi:hypothetical protein